jgi:hypothetical protein
MADDQVTHPHQPVVVADQSGLEHDQPGPDDRQRRCTSRKPGHTIVPRGPLTTNWCSWPVNPGSVTVNPDPVIVKLVTVTVSPDTAMVNPERAGTNENRSAGDAGSASVHPVQLERVPSSIA